MFFSRIILREDARQNVDFWQAFRSPYALHQSLWQLFGDHPDRRRDFLYRVEQDQKKPVVYSVSTRTPETADSLWQVEAKPYEPKLRAGDRLGFMLRANPVRSREGKRHDVVMEAKHNLKVKAIPRKDWPSEAELVQESTEKWLRDRAEKAGLIAMAIQADGYRQHEFIKARGDHPVRFSTVDLTGMLEVVDPALFSEVLFHGLGPAKGFGCGLVLVRRI